ncbi:MAG TPA: lysophospholipid acyltransferase family protein [Chitinophagales bacterium]|nr:lysophospholipid acyltransferase family protein [Chitinophagales bacterium]
MAEWKGKSRGNKLGYSIFVFLIKNFGVYPAYAVLYLVVLYYFFFSSETSGHIYRYFNRRIGYSKIKSFFKIYTSYYRLGQMLIDKTMIMAGMKDKFTSESFGAENLRAIVAQKKGGILLGAHLGNWEIAGHYLMNYGDTINILVYDREHEQIKQYMEQVTGGRKFKLIAIKDDLSHIYEIGEALERNEIIATTADRFLGEGKTRTFKFLGEDARFPAGIFQIIKTFRANYSFVYGVKKRATHYNFYCRPHRTVTNETTIDMIMEDYVRDLEVMVKENPDQWFNYYDFWKK